MIFLGAFRPSSLCFEDQLKELLAFCSFVGGKQPLSWISCGFCCKAEFFFTKAGGLEECFTEDQRHLRLTF